MILAGQREFVAAWVASRIRDMREPPRADYEAIGVTRGGRIIGGVIYAEYRKMEPDQADIRTHWAGEPGWMTRKTLRVLFGYPFQQLGCVRITALTSRGNKRALDASRRLGFQIEGCVRDGFGTGKDALLLGMLRRECRWIGE
jgi:RimJ/RimL family protein N-acetyltransferase